MFHHHSDSVLAQTIRNAAVPLAEHDPHDALLELVGDARFVLLGEASHGTQEFYRERARITRRLITEKGFHAVAVEADWPDAYRVNRFVRGLQGADADGTQALSGFERFPTWMWRNTEVQAFITWLRQFNASHHGARRAGFYGLDLYSLHRSMAQVLAFLERTAPEAAKEARERYACFDHFGDDSQRYGFMTGVHGAQDCRDEVLAVLRDVQRQTSGAVLAGNASAEDAFAARQNAHLVKHAESYYRGMYLGEEPSWNLRDRHMMHTLQQLDQHLARAYAPNGEPAKIVVWAHNSHLGDARATDMCRTRGELSLGQLVRQHYPGQCCLVGFTTHTGMVTAAHDWNMPAQRMHVIPSRHDSVEGLLHACGLGKFLLPLRGNGAHVKALTEPRLERAIGVVYRPRTERHSHYFSASLAQQFDAVVHIDHTNALQPLLGQLQTAKGEMELPETYPTGM